MEKKIIDHIDNCITCLLSNSSTHSRENELTSNLVKLFKILHLGHFGPLQMIEDEFRHVLVIVDSFTRFTWFFSTKLPI